MDSTEGPSADPQNMPYIIEYAKSGRSSCKGCKTTINAGEVRFGSVNDQGDHVMTHWKHVECLTEKQMANIEEAGGIAAVTGFSDLKPADRTKVEKRAKELRAEADAIEQAKAEELAEKEERKAERARAAEEKKAEKAEAKRVREAEKKEKAAKKRKAEELDS